MGNWWAVPGHPNSPVTEWHSPRGGGGDDDVWNGKHVTNRGR